MTVLEVCRFRTHVWAEGDGWRAWTVLVVASVGVLALLRDAGVGQSGPCGFRHSTAACRTARNAETHVGARSGTRTGADSHRITDRVRALNLVRTRNAAPIDDDDDDDIE